MGFSLPVRAQELELLLLLLLALGTFDSTQAWYSPSLPNLSSRGRMSTATITSTSECRRRACPRPFTATPRMNMLPIDDSTMDLLSSSTSWLADAVVQATSDAASEVASSSPSSWRQYVPLVVSGGVLTDIVLGSPVANKVMSGMRPPAEDEASVDGGASTKTKVDPVLQKKQERIDTQAYARAALNKAENTLSLRKYLDENKSESEKMNDLKRIMDKQMEELDKKNRRD
jgi:hypothetical protein